MRTVLWPLTDGDLPELLCWIAFRVGGSRKYVHTLLPHHHCNFSLAPAVRSRGGLILILPLGAAAVGGVC